MSVAQEIFSSLSDHPKNLSRLQWLHYDDIIVKAAGNEKNRLRIVELGAGTATKTSILLRAAIKYQGGPINYLFTY